MLMIVSNSLSAVSLGQNVKAQQAQAPQPRAVSKESPTKEPGDLGSMSAYVSSEITPEWGFKGHELIHDEAVRALPSDMPEFFVDARERLVALASQPDRLKMRELPHLRIGRVDHWVSMERLEGVELPRDRYGYILASAEQGLALPGQSPEEVGTLQYSVAEHQHKLTAEFALWRNELERSGPDHPRTKQFQENAIYTAGMMGHYVGDASQPLHASVHHDGWNEDFEPNPEGFRTQRGLHREFENLLVNRNIHAEGVRARIGEFQTREGDPLDWAMDFLREAQGEVRNLYTLEKNGDLNPNRPSDEGVALAEKTLARGAQNLRDLWYQAWVDSEKVADSIRRPQGGDDHQHEHGQDGYLIAG